MNKSVPNWVAAHQDQETDRSSKRAKFDRNPNCRKVHWSNFACTVVASHCRGQVQWIPLLPAHEVDQHEVDRNPGGQAPTAKSGSRLLRAPSARFNWWSQSQVRWRRGAEPGHLRWSYGNIKTDVASRSSSLEAHQRNRVASNPTIPLLPRNNHKTTLRKAHLNSFLLGNSNQVNRRVMLIYADNELSTGTNHCWGNSTRYEFLKL